MGGRRAHEQGAVAAARAAYIAGFDSTSNLEAGRQWGIPTMGTSAHSFTLLHDSEKEAFKAQLDSMGLDTTLLVDTFNVDEAVRTAVELAGPKLGAVRIDSGDLTENAKRVRELLDSLGATKTKITVTSDLDEYAIAALAAAPVDGYGVGTSLVTGSGSPTAGFVYKLVSHTDGGEWVDVAKTSTAKTNRGGEKFAYRKLTNGKATAEVISKEPNSNLGRELQVALVTDGKIHHEFTGKAGVLKARTHHAKVRQELPEAALRLSKGDGALVLEAI
jgi:nicotinate phosphoribosyltransferase